jgi:hypothetical protein
VRAGGTRRLRVALALAALALAAAGCGAAEQADAPASEPGAQPSATASIGAPATATAIPTTTAPPSRILDAAGVAELLRRAVCWHHDPARAAECVPPTEATARAIEELGRSGDPRFTAPLVDMLWIEIGWRRWVEDALEAITGERLTDTQAWSAWVAEYAPPLPAGYAGWKGRLLSLVDPRFTELLADGRAHEPRVEELLWAGVRVGGLPPLNAPATVHRVEERYLDGDDVVFGVQIGGEPRAYPERIVAWHGALRDEVDGAAVLLLHCVPCGSAAAFEGKLDGRELRLVASGLLYRSRMLFADEETGSLWDPVSGRAIMGPAFEAGERLTPLPLRRASWAEWSALHPTTRVLALDTGFVRDYDAGVALEVETGAAAPLYPAAPLDERLPAKERVLGITLATAAGSAAHAYRLAELERAGITALTLGGEDLVLLSRGPGSGVAAYLAPPAAIAELVLTETSGLLAVDSEGERWFVSEEGLVSTLDSARRAAVPTTTAYWFAWAGAWPTTGLDDR